MINSLRLSNFKIFDSIELNGITPFTIVGGLNDTGKTSLLTAIFIYTSRLQPAMPSLAQSRGVSSTDWAATYFRGFQMRPDMAVEITLKVDGRECLLKIDYVDAIQEQEIFASSAPSEPADGSDAVPPGAAASGNAEEIASQLAMPTGKKTVSALRMRWFEAADCIADIYAILPLPPASPAAHRLMIKHSFPGTPLASALVFPFMRGSVPTFAQLLGRVVEAGEFECLLQGVRRVFPGIHNLSTVYSPPAPPSILVDIGLQKPVPLSEFGDGFRELLGAWLPMPLLRNGVLLCDELGVGIHASKLPAFVSQMAAMAKRYNCQIIATTHSYELLVAAHGAFAEADMKQSDFSYFRLDKSGSGALSAVRFDHAALGAAIAKNWEVR
ncbi:MAG: AAA family ATPase [Phycisphaerae bacterium]